MVEVAAPPRDAPRQRGNPVSAYGPYELLRTLINRVAWPNMEEMQRALESVDEYERMNMFGNLAQQAACKHEDIHVVSYLGGAVCNDCGRIM